MKFFKFGSSCHSVALPLLFALSFLPAPLCATDSEDFHVSVAQEPAIQVQPDHYGWQPKFFGAGVAGTVHAITTYQGHLVFAGNFKFGGADEYNGIALWDGQNLFPLKSPSGVGVNGQVNALAVYNGDLIAAGDFTEAGGVGVGNIAKWDGVSWTNLSQGTSGPVHAMTVFENELIVGGEFVQVGDQTVNFIARWNGSSWSALTGNDGTGASSRVYTLTVYNGELVAGGDFSSAGGIPVLHIARWDGIEWHPLTDSDGTGTNGAVRALQEYHGELIVAGSFGSAGSMPAPRIARWTGTEWKALDSCCGGIGGLSTVHALAVFNDDLVVGGQFGWVAGMFIDSIARWTGTQWQSMAGQAGPGNSDRVHALEVFDGELIVGAGGASSQTKVRGIVRWNGSEWLQLNGTGHAGLFGTVSASIVYEDRMIVGGRFEVAGTQVVNHIAQWNGTSWDAVGTGLNFEVADLTVFEDNLIAVGTYFESPHNRAAVAVWNGSEWAELPALTAPQNSGATSAIVFNDTLVVGGRFSHAGGTQVNNIAGWNGSQWENLSMGESIGTSGRVNALASYNDILVVGGYFGSAGGQTAVNIARWDGFSWRSFPGGGVTGTFPRVSSLAVLGSDLYVGGRFDSAGETPAANVARWDGEDWHALGEGTGLWIFPVSSLSAWNDELVAGGAFPIAGNVLVNRIARWDGADWVALGGPDEVGITGGGVLTILPLGNRLLAGGTFDFAGGVPSWNVGKFRLEPSEVEITHQSSELSDIGEPVLVTARVQGVAAAPADARGTISSSSGDSCTTLDLNVEDDSSSSFTCSLEMTSGGLHNLTATFTASPTHERSTSEPVSHMVRFQSHSSITGLSPDSSQVAGQPVQIFVDVSGSSDPAGTIDIGNGNTTLCTITLPDNNCGFILHEIGKITLYANYSGDDAHGPSSDSVTYEITESALAFAPNPLMFGEIGIGHISDPGSVTITNVSDQSLSIDKISLPTDAVFSMTGSSCGTPPLTLPVDADCTLEFQFAPIQPGPDNLVVGVESDTPEGVHVFFLQGIGMDAILHDRFQEN